MPYDVTAVFVHPADIIAELEGTQPAPEPEPAPRGYAHLWRTALGDDCPHTTTSHEVGLDD